MWIQTSIYSLIFKITASNFHGMLLRDSSLQRQHKLNFDQVNHRYLLSYPGPYLYVIWASTRENLTRKSDLVVYINKQQRYKSGCTPTLRSLFSVFAIQFLEMILSYKSCILNFKILASPCIRTNWLESYLVSNWENRLFYYFHYEGHINREY